MNRFIYLPFIKGKVILMPSLGISDEELEAALMRRLASNHASDPRVCVCGHPARCHTELAPEGSPVHVEAREQGRNICAQTRMVCPCVKFEPVVSVTDVRRFKYRTHGPGSDHALSLGIRQTRIKGGSVELLDGWVCRFCKTETEGLVPVAYRLNADGYPIAEAEQPTKANALVCVECRTRIRAGE